MKPSLVIIGLGNPGAQYAATRHNTGFLSVDVLAKEFGTGEWELKQKFLAEVCEGRIVTVPILLVKPTTFMNRSGECARKIVDFYKLDPKIQLLVICDDIDLPVGDLRLRQSGGPGTHNGLKSLVEQIGEGFPRIRIGIGAPARTTDRSGGPARPSERSSEQRPEEDLSTYVLSNPLPTEKKKIAVTIEKVPEMVRGFVMERIDM